MSRLVRAYLIEVGNIVNFNKRFEVKTKRVRADIATFFLKINDEKSIKIIMPADSFLEVHDPNPEPTEMPDETEILDRVLALAIVPGRTLPYEVLAYLVEQQVFDIPRLIELTNDLGPFEAEPTAKCRVCGCTDDDCSQCIEATGEPCSWANEDHTLCSRCQQAAMNQLYQNLKS